MTSRADARPVDLMASQLDSLAELYRLIIESQRDGAVEDWLRANLDPLVERLLGACAISPGLVRSAGDAAPGEQAAAAAVQAALADTCKAALEELRSRCAGGAVRDFASFYRQWVECFEQHYERLLCDPAFGRDFGALVNLLLAAGPRASGPARH